ncbi:hypothetical protein CPC735_014960 [Coccidioides posadasii C735 delta SOWgp]|uniref:Protein kinase domain-containing protein n=1 Tax=Coccidioides posadasii (strain C735) TaxID=222929 RepID=C5PCT7_COCP7|nr:hypothetical protein CPC735_014960 [Coccidioides posadasii C735 delta SOWgp]EER24898.1 hypothetical protein CPC735_014960 [Coccidioides posadasii C735 delta SOWgp]|eukprot:XP_003067043.1 hypothetical protein CPC735_014960 [Coccidioides posadasii C735 delta SOWgp]
MEEDELTRLRRLYEEEKRLREEEQRRREAAESNALEAQLRREAAEELARGAQPQTVEQYLEACHSLQLSIQIVTNPALTTQGEPTNPSNRLFPRRIIPWGEDFAMQQEAIWNQLKGSSLFSSQPLFPSQHSLQFVKSYLRPLSSENCLRYFERDVVENPVQTLMDEVYKDSTLRDALGFRGTVTFESHTNLEPSPVPPGATKPRRKARGKGNQADQYCVYRDSGGGHIPVFAIEYKAPHKLRLDELVTGLESEIQPERDVINKNGGNFAFAAKCLAAAIVTQLFSYMIGKGIQYGYVCTGEAFVFLHIPNDDPTIVYFSLCVPSLDVMDDDQTRLHRTAAAQAFAFAIQALSVDPPPASWHDRTTTLDVWPVEYDDVLRDIPETVRKEPRATPYKPQRWKGFKRSPIQTRSRCKPLDSDMVADDDSSSSEEGPPSPSPKHSYRSGRRQALMSPGTRSDKKPNSSRRGQQPVQQRVINNRPFCTQKCLLGLANGGPVDETCPNFEHHGPEHISQQEFQQLIREQLAKDRGPDADCVPLYISGALGSLFKVCLSSHSYTMVAKGMESFDLDRLQHENKIYNRLRSIQGKYVPVCLGMVDLILPYYYDCGVFSHFLFLSWGGQPLAHCMNLLNKQNVTDTVTAAYKEMHKLGVLHCDAAPRNVLHDKHTGTVMIVDFERSELDSREALGPISPNAGNRKRKRVISRQGEDAFARELSSIVTALSRMEK